MRSLVAKQISLKLIQEVVLYINTYEQDMTEAGNENNKIKNQDK